MSGVFFSYCRKLQFVKLVFLASKEQSLYGFVPYRKRPSMQSKTSFCSIRRELRVETLAILWVPIRVFLRFKRMHHISDPQEKGVVWGGGFKSGYRGQYQEFNLSKKEKTRARARRTDDCTFRTGKNCGAAETQLNA